MTFSSALLDKVTCSSSIVLIPNLLINLGLVLFRSLGGGAGNKCDSLEEQQTGEEEKEPDIRGFTHRCFKILTAKIEMSLTSVRQASINLPHAQAAIIKHFWSALKTHFQPEQGDAGFYPTPKIHKLFDLSCFCYFLSSFLIQMLTSCQPGPFLVSLIQTSGMMEFFISSAMRVFKCGLAELTALGTGHRLVLISGFLGSVWGHFPLLYFQRLAWRHGRFGRLGCFRISISTF